MKSFSAELVAASLNSQKKELKPEDSKKIAIARNTSAEIGQCLSLRRVLAASPVVPTDPLYQIYQNRNRLELNLQTATTWWKYCKEESNSPSLEAFEEWPLAVQLKSDLEKANAELAVLRPGKSADAIPSSGTAVRIKMNPLITRQLVEETSKRPSVLDQIAGWEKLPEVQKSKFIVP